MILEESSDMVYVRVTVRDNTHGDGAMLCGK